MGGFVCCVGGLVWLSESEVVGSGCTQRPRTDSRSTGTILWVDSAGHCELGHWRWLMELGVAVVHRSRSQSLSRDGG